MKTRAYSAAEKAIAAADTNGIRERWLYGLRLLHDEDAIAPGGGLKHGVAQRLTDAASRRGVKLADREIQRRMQVARAYPKESQIRHAMTDFETWYDLVNSGFPAYEADPDEPDADWRTKAEKSHASAQRLADLIGDQGVLFPFDQFEPDESQLKDLIAYAEEQAAMTARFVARDQDRADYLEQLREAVADDLSATWQEAHWAAFGEDVEDSEAEAAS